MSDFVELVLPNVLRPCVTPAIKGYNSIRPQSLAELNDLRIQQGLIIKDLLFVFLGLEGFYIRYSEKYDLGSADSRIRGPDFKIAKHLDISLKSITKKLIKYGRYYSALKSFIEIYDTHQSGKVLQRLCFEIEKFLCRYEQLVVQIEQEFETNSGFNLSFLENNVLRSSEVSVEIDLLYDIVTLIHEESAVRYKQSKHAAVNDEAYFQNFIKTIQNDLRETGSINLTTDQTNFELCKGGLILQKIQKLSSERYLGDSVKSGIANKLFDSISIDYVDMLNGWLINGEINDPYDEFLIKENKIEGKVGSQYSEKYWEEVYVTRIDGIIEQFQSRDLQMKLLATGKFLNIFKICTGVNDTSIGNEVVGIISLSSRDLELKIHEFYLRANKLLMKLYFEGYQLTTLIEKLQGVYFLKDSFDIDNFIRKSFNDLRRNKYGVSISKLKRQYEEEEQKHILRKNDSDDLDELSVTLNMDYTNFYDLAREILDVQSFDAMSALDSSSKFKTLLNKSLERNNPPISSGSLGSSTTTGGAIFDPDQSDDYSIVGINLETTIDFPLNLMIGQNFIFQYQLIFKLLVLTKFINRLSDNTWKEINYSTVWKYRFFQPKIRKWILRSRILLNRMSDFMRELQFYLNEDIIEKNYKDLQNELEQSEESLNNEQGMASSKTDSYLVESRFNTFNNNSIFDKNIFQRQQTTSQRTVSNSTMASTVVNGTSVNALLQSPDIDFLRNKIGTFLNNILRHSLITNKELIDILKRIYDLIILYNHYLNRLKKTIVLLDASLFESFKHDYPERFEGRSIDSYSIDERYTKVNDNLNWYFEKFNDSMGDFMNILKRFGESENQSLLILMERLENCFPE